MPRICAECREFIGRQPYTRSRDGAYFHERCWDNTVPKGPTPHTLRALHLLGASTNFRFDVWMLAGGPRASVRAHVMSELLGKRVPQKDSGIHAIQDTFYKAARIEGDCLAAREENFIAWCKQHIAEASAFYRKGCA